MTVKQLTARIGIDALVKFSKDKERNDSTKNEAAQTRVKRVVQDLELENAITRISGRPYSFKYQGAPDSTWLLHQLLSVDDSITNKLPTRAQQSLSLLNLRSNKLRQFNSWEQKIFIARSGFVGKPKIDEQCAKAVYTALEHEQYLSLEYITAKGDIKSLIVYPWGLIFKGDACYLVANKSDGVYIHPVMYAMHRIKEASIIKSELGWRGQPPAPDSFHRFCKDHKVEVFPKNTDRDIQLIVRLRADYCTLRETPISDDQVIEKLDLNWLRVTGTVKDCSELRKFILGYGSNIVVEYPLDLRAEIKSCLQETLVAY